MHPVETAYHVLVDEINHRFRHRAGFVPGFMCMHAFLDHGLGHLLSFLDGGHFRPLFPVQVVNFLGALHGHHAHTVSAGIRLDHHERIIGYAVFIVFLTDGVQ